MNTKEIKEQLLTKLLDAQKALKERLETQDQMIERFQALIKYDNLFIQIIDYFPYPIAVFSPDGTLEIANNTLLTKMAKGAKNSIINKYNLFRDADLIEEPVRNALRRALKGETVFLFDLHNPLKTIMKPHGIKTKDLSYSDGVFFPINNGTKVSHAVVVLIHQH